MPILKNHRTAAFLTALLGLVGLLCYALNERGVTLPHYLVFWQEIAMGCWLAASALDAVGWWHGKAEEDDESGTEITEALDSENIVGNDATNLSTAGGEAALVHAYVRKFYDRYGTLFEDLQTLPLPPTASARAAVLQKLIEMALHAHSFAYYGIMDRLAQLDQSPNARLLLQNRPAAALPTARPFTTDAYQTDAKYRALYEIVRSIPIQELDVLLEDQVYVPPDFFVMKES